MLSVLNIIHSFCEKEYIAAVTIILSNTIKLLVSVRFLCYLANKIWVILTPGQKFIEISLMIICLILFILIGIVANDILQKLEKSFNKMENTIKEKTKKIIELEEKLSKYLK